MNKEHRMYDRVTNKQALDKMIEALRGDDHWLFLSDQDRYRQSLRRFVNVLVELDLHGFGLVEANFRPEGVEAIDVTFLFLEKRAWSRKRCMKLIRHLLGGEKPTPMEENDSHFPLGPNRKSLRYCIEGILDGRVYPGPEPELN